MTNRRISFQQVMIIPTLTTLGLGSLLYAQNLSLTSPVSAAPLPVAPLIASNVLPAAIPAAMSSQAPTAPASATVPSTDPEFGGEVAVPAQSQPIVATTHEEMLRMARESAGREDPFVALINPDPTIIQPLPQPPKPVRVFKYFSAPKIIHPVIPVEQSVVIDPPEPGDAPPTGPLIVPRWTVEGILNTGRQQLALLEKDGDSQEVHLGDVLEDGSRVVKIESNKVVLMLNGRRFPKTIGGTEGTND